jgi:Ca-activated chloride channel homolog
MQRLTRSIALGLTATTLAVALGCSMGPLPDPSLQPESPTMSSGASRASPRAMAPQSDRLFRESQRSGTPSLPPDTTFEHYGVNPTVDTEEERFSTFSIDVDTASYGMARSYLLGGTLIPEAAERVEEFVNAFEYGYAPPKQTPFALSAEAFPSPSRPGYHVLHLALATRALDSRERRPANLVFVIDASGSMAGGGRLHLVKQALEVLLDGLTPRDRVGIVTFQDSAELRLPLTPADQRDVILRTIDEITPNGSTNAEAGLELGYSLFHRALLPGTTNRVILCSDGVANSGLATTADAIYARLRERAQRGIALSTVGVGMANYNDVLLEKLAQMGDGNYAYIDDQAEAERLFSDRLASTLDVLARDVKIQVEFDPQSVSRWRLLGYENRRLEREDFADDRVDAGEVGPGHSVTALFEVKLRPAAASLGAFRVRYAGPDGGAAQQAEHALTAKSVRASFDKVTPAVRLAYVAAEFAEKLRGSYWVRKVRYEDLLRWHRGLPTALRERPDVRELGDLIARSEVLDRRADKYAGTAETEPVDWDQVPVLK